MAQPGIFKTPARRWSRRLREALAAFLVLVLVASAGFGDARAAGDRARPAAPVTLRFGVWMAEQAPALRKIADEFHASHSGITIDLEFTPFSSYWTRLQTEAKQKRLPDVFAMNVPSFPYFASHHLLLPLNSRIKRDHLNLQHYPSSVIASSIYKHTVYGLPKDFDVIGLWYNKAMFDAAGVGYPDSTWTWATLYAAAKKLTDHKKGIWGIAAQLKDQEGYYNTIYQAGGYVISADRKRSGFDNPKTIRGLEFWTDLIRLGYSPPARQLTNANPDAKNTLFMSGKVAMIFGGDWLARTFASNTYLRGKADVAPLPSDARPATVIQSTSWVIPATTRHAREAWEFLKFLGSARAAYIQADSGFVIPAYLGTQSVWTSTWPQMHLKSFLGELIYSIPYPASIDSAAWQTMANQYLARAWAGTMTLSTAARTIARKMNADLRAEQRK